MLAGCEKSTSGTAITSAPISTENKPSCKVTSYGFDISHHLDTSVEQGWTKELGDANMQFGWVEDRNPVEVNVAVGENKSPEDKALANRLEQEATAGLRQLASEKGIADYPRFADDIESAQLPDLKAAEGPYGHRATLYLSAQENPDTLC